MVSVGTLLSLGIIGAIGIGAYALYRSSGAVGSALSRGVETSLVNPIIDWANSLFKISPASVATSGSSVPNTNTPQDIIVQQGGQVVNTQFVDDPTKFNPPGVTHYGYPNSPYGIPISNGSTSRVTSTPTPTGTAYSVDLFEGGAPPGPSVPPVTSINGVVQPTFPEKLYKLLTTGGQCIGTTCIKPIPLSTSQIYNYAIQGKLAHQVYL